MCASIQMVSLNPSMVQMPASVPVTPAPHIQKYSKPVQSLSLKRLGVYSTNPLKLTKKSPLTNLSQNIHDGEILEEVEQIDTNLFQLDIVDENGYTSTYTIIVPLEDDTSS